MNRLTTYISMFFFLLMAQESTATLPPPSMQQSSMQHHTAVEMRDVNIVPQTGIPLTGSGASALSALLAGGTALTTDAIERGLLQDVGTMDASQQEEIIFTALAARGIPSSDAMSRTYRVAQWFSYSFQNVGSFLGGCSIAVAAFLGQESPIFGPAMIVGGALSLFAPRLGAAGAFFEKLTREHRRKIVASHFLFVNLQAAQLQPAPEQQATESGTSSSSSRTAQ